MSTRSSEYPPTPRSSALTSRASRTARRTWFAAIPDALPALTGFGLAALLLAAFRGLMDFDPAAGPGSTGSRVEDVLFEPTATSPMLVFGGTAWLFARRAGRIRARLGGAPALHMMIPALGAGSALCVWSYMVVQPALLLPSLSFVLIGTAAWLGGVPLVRAVALPSLFLLFAFPLPAPLVNQFIYPLQLATAQIVGSGLNAAGLSTRTEGDLLYHQQQIFQVIESCSGVRGAATLFMTSFLFHDLFFRSRLQSFLVVAASIPIALLVNQIRVATIVLNPYSEFAAVHTAQGLVMVVVGVLLLAGWDSLLSRFLPPAVPVRRSRVSSPAPTLRLGMGIALFGLLAVATFRVEAWPIDPPRTLPLSSLSSLPGWQTQSLKLDRSYLGTVSFSEWVHRRYTRDGEVVEVLLGSDTHVDPRVDFSSPKVGIPAAGYVFSSRRRVELPSGRPVERVESERGGQKKIAYVWRYNAAGPEEEVLRSLLALDRSPWRRQERTVLVRVLTPADASAEEVERRLRDFSADIERDLDRILDSGGV